MAAAAAAPVHAENMAALGEVLLYGVAVVGIIWCVLAAVVFYCLRRLAAWKRWGLTLFFLFFPVGWLGLEIAGEWLLGRVGGTESVIASREPVMLAGVTFPAGSRIDYDQQGMGHRRLRGAQAPEPLFLGDLRIMGLRLTDPPDESRLEITLSVAQSVEGWPCAAERDVMARRTGDRLSLDLCALQPFSLGNLDWPEGALVRHDLQGDWDVAWFNSPRTATADCDQVIEAFGFRFNRLRATYDRRRQLQLWDGTTCNAEIRVGRFTVAPWATVALQPDGAIRISGKARDGRGKEVDCLELRAGSREVRSCSGS